MAGMQRGRRKWKADADVVKAVVPEVRGMWVWSDLGVALIGVTNNQKKRHVDAEKKPKNPNFVFELLKDVHCDHFFWEALFRKPTGGTKTQCASTFLCESFVVLVPYFAQWQNICLSFVCDFVKYSYSGHEIIACAENDRGKDRSEQELRHVFLLLACVRTKMCQFNK